jgi:hypothetical protein
MTNHEELFFSVFSASPWLIFFFPHPRGVTIQPAQPDAWARPANLPCPLPFGGVSKSPGKRYLLGNERGGPVP